MNSIASEQQTENVIGLEQNMRWHVYFFRFRLGKQSKLSKVIVKKRKVKFEFARQDSYNDKVCL